MFIPIHAQQRIKSATALLVALSKVTSLPEVQAASRRAVGQLVQLEAETMVEQLVSILMDLFDLQGFARMHGRTTSADCLEGIRMLVREAYDIVKRGY